MWIHIFVMRSSAVVKTISHQLEIETNGYACKAMEEKIYQLCHYDQELEELYAILLFQTKILSTHTLQGNGIRNLLMLMTILARNQETEKLLENKTATNLIHTELSQPYLATSHLPPMLQVNPWLHNQCLKWNIRKGSLQIGLGPSLLLSRNQGNSHPTPRCFARFGDLSILNQPIWSYFRGRSFSPSNFRMLSA